MTKFISGDTVFCRALPDHPGLVCKVGRKYIHVDWGTWVKPMLPQHLVKPKEVACPGMSGDGVTTTLVQTDGEDFPPALSWATRKGGNV